MGKNLDARDMTNKKAKAATARRQSLAVRARGFVTSRLRLQGTAIAHEDTLVMSPVKLPGADHARKLDEKASSLWRKTKCFFSQLALTKEDETAYFEPRTWAFWRGIIMYFFLFSVVGHWMEIPYCLSMDALFGIVDADYAIFLDELYVPYWVYGAGAAAITILLLPLKIRLVGRRKTMWGAALEFFVMAVADAVASSASWGGSSTSRTPWASIPTGTTRSSPLTSSSRPGSSTISSWDSSHSATSGSHSPSARSSASSSAIRQPMGCSGLSSRFSR